jgi:HlyD family secretion protein
VAGQIVLQVIDPASLWVRARVDQGRSGGLAVAMPAEIVLRSRPGTPSPGRIERLDILGDAVTEERIVQVGFAQMPDGVTVGELAEVTLRLPAVEGALAVPSAALKRSGSTRGVWLLDGGRARFRAVAVGAETLDGQSQVTSGLKPDETLIVHSSQPLAEGLRVKVTDSLVKGAP